MHPEEAESHIVIGTLNLSGLKDLGFNIVLLF